MVEDSTVFPDLKKGVLPPFTLVKFETLSEFTFECAHVLDETQENLPGRPCQFPPRDEAAEMTRRTFVLVRAGVVGWIWSTKGSKFSGKPPS